MRLATRQGWQGGFDKAKAKEVARRQAGGNAAGTHLDGLRALSWSWTIASRQPRCSSTGQKTWDPRQVFHNLLRSMIVGFFWFGSDKGRRISGSRNGSLVRKTNVSRKKGGVSPRWFERRLILNPGASAWQRDRLRGMKAITQGLRGHWLIHWRSIPVLGLELGSLKNGSFQLGFHTLGSLRRKGDEDSR